MKSVNGAAFGCSREELRALFGEPDCSFLKDPDDAVDTDDYGTFHVFYDDGYRFEALEVVACDEAEIFYDGERLPESYSEVLEFFNELYDDVDEDDCGFISEDGSVGAYIENDDDELDTILFGREDYYRS